MKLADIMGDFFLGLTPETAFVAGQLLISGSIFEAIFLGKIFDLLYDGFMWLCKKGFALVKRKFGKEK